MIVSVGNDVVLVERFEAALKRTPMLAERLFTDAERRPLEASRAADSLAARFAAKEAVLRRWVHRAVAMARLRDRGRSRWGPWLTITGTVAAAAAERGIERWHLSLSHDGGIASAVVIAEAGLS